MDFTSIVAALVTGAVTVLGVLISNSKTQAVMHERIDVLRRDISELTEDVKKHNGLVERMVVQEQSNKALWKKVDEHTEHINELMKRGHE